MLVGLSLLICSNEMFASFFDHFPQLLRYSPRKSKISTGLFLFFHVDKQKFFGTIK